MFVTLEMAGVTLVLGHWYRMEDVMAVVGSDLEEEA